LVPDKQLSIVRRDVRRDVNCRGVQERLSKDPFGEYRVLVENVGGEIALAAAHVLASTSKNIVPNTPERVFRAIFVIVGDVVRDAGDSWFKLLGVSSLAIVDPRIAAIRFVTFRVTLRVDRPWRPWLW
jgi:hypothetical protein